jgi:hypothetical protein
VRKTGNTFAPVFSSFSGGQAGGIGGYDLADPADRVFAFDYNNSGKLDHLVLYRPGTGTIWIVRNTAGTFAPVYSGGGVPGYPLTIPADRVFAFDYDSSGKLDHLVLYRPGTGVFWIVRKTGNTFAPVFSSFSGGQAGGIGGYDLADPADQVFAFDYDSSGKLDHLVLYRPGTGTIWILAESSAGFSPVYRSDAAGPGIGGYYLADSADRVFAFDLESSGKLDHLVLYRPGQRIIRILRKGS